METQVATLVWAGVGCMTLVVSVTCLVLWRIARD